MVMPDLKKILSLFEKNWKGILVSLLSAGVMIQAWLYFSSWNRVILVTASLFVIIAIGFALWEILNFAGTRNISSLVSRVVTASSLIVVLAGCTLSSSDLAALGFGVFLIGFILMLLHEGR